MDKFFIVRIEKARNRAFFRVRFKQILIEFKFFLQFLVLLFKFCVLIDFAICELVFGFCFEKNMSRL